jgi:hypothetical protein
MYESNWEIVGLAEEKTKARIKKDNIAFRKRLREQKAQEREKAKLKLVSAIAALSWLFVCIQVVSQFSFH